MRDLIIRSHCQTMRSNDRICNVAPSNRRACALGAAPQHLTCSARSWRSVLRAQYPRANQPSACSGLMARPASQCFACIQHCACELSMTDNMTQALISNLDRAELLLISCKMFLTRMQLTSKHLMSKLDMMLCTEHSLVPGRAKTLQSPSAIAVWKEAFG